MRIVFTSYTYSAAYQEPSHWLTRIDAYVGILEELSKLHQVISIEQINFEGRVVRNGVDYRFLRPTSTLFPFALHNYIEVLKPEIVFIHGLHFPLQVIQLRKKLPKKVKIFIQNHAERPTSLWKKFFQRIADKGVSGYFFASKEMGQQWLENKIISTPAKIHQVMEASSIFRKRNKELARKITGVVGNPAFLWVGRLDANKDPLTVVNAFREFLLREPGATLYMIFHAEQLREEVAALTQGYQDNIVLVGKIPHPNLEAWFNSADFIVSGSHYEGSGVAVCEGMSCGCIPLVTNIASFRMMTNNGTCGRLYEAGNARELLSMFYETQKMNIAIEKEKVLQQFATNLSFEAIAKKISQVLDPA